MKYVERLSGKAKRVLKMDSGHLQSRQNFENTLKKFSSIDFIESQQDLYSKPHTEFWVFSLLFILQLNRKKMYLKCFI